MKQGLESGRSSNYWGRKGGNYKSALGLYLTILRMKFSIWSVGSFHMMSQSNGSCLFSPTFLFLFFCVYVCVFFFFSIFLFLIFFCEQGNLVHIWLWVVLFLNFEWDSFDTWCKFKVWVWLSNTQTESYWAKKTVWVWLQPINS